MEPIAFVAASAEEAVAQIRARLGPQAEVLNVRPLPAHGLARLWQKPMIEVLAHVPEPAAPQADPLTQALAEFKQRLEQIEQHVKTPARPESLPEFVSPGAPLDSGGWRLGEILQRTGLLPIHAQAILEQARAERGDLPPPTLAGEIALARKILPTAWRPAPAWPTHSLHVILGPAGSGKTTSLCKWLTQVSLVEGHLAKVWRLDGETANMAESLTVYCEILHVAHQRAWSGGEMAEDIGFVDLPGIDWRRPGAVAGLAGQLATLGQPHLHLALNGAYDISVLQAQIRAFAGLPLEDLIITHLDEETRWGKLWNLVLGSDLPIRWLSTGQNIPGDFFSATPEIILDRQFPAGR